MGWGVVQYGTAVPHLTTPTPIPSPQGGGEEFASLVNRILAPIAPVPATLLAIEVAETSPAATQ
jgi:hypothetical protein